MPKLDNLAGRWRLRRRIADLRTGETARFRGNAIFVRTADALEQREVGVLTLPARPPMRAVRTYLWTAAGERLVVRFDDGAPFHDFDARLVAPTATHPCGDDLYRVRYDFRRWPRWRSVWRVTGPRKDLIIVSAFVPLAP